MARVLFDPENDRRAELAFPRVDMRSPELRAKQSRSSSLQGIRARIIAAAEARVLQAEKVLATAEAELAEAKEVVARKRVRFTYAEIEKRACRLFGVTRSQLNSRRRFAALVFARHFIAYWAIRLTALSYPLVGRLMGDRDHTTILHGCKIYVSKRAAQGRTLRPAR